MGKQNVYAGVNNTAIKKTLFQQEKRNRIQKSSWLNFNAIHALKYSDVMRNLRFVHGESMREAKIERFVTLDKVSTTVSRICLDCLW